MEQGNWVSNTKTTVGLWGGVWRAGLETLAQSSNYLIRLSLITYQWSYAWLIILSNGAFQSTRFEAWGTPSIACFSAVIDHLPARKPLDSNRKMDTKLLFSAVLNFSCLINFLIRPYQLYLINQITNRMTLFCSENARSCGAPNAPKAWNLSSSDSHQIQFTESFRRRENKIQNLSVQRFPEDVGIWSILLALRKNRPFMTNHFIKAAYQKKKESGSIFPDQMQRKNKWTREINPIAMTWLCFPCLTS